MSGFKSKASISTVSFLAGAAAHRLFTPRPEEPSNLRLNTQTCAAYLSKELLKEGWRPREVMSNEKGIPSIFISHFKPALTGSIVYAFIKHGDDYFVLINKQKRRDATGTSMYMADMPCGFYNARQEGLGHTQKLIGAMGRLGEKRKLLTHEEIQNLAHQLLLEKTDGTGLVDKTAEANALRELHEETGFSPKNKKGTLVNIESLNEGAYWYFRYAFLDVLKPQEQKPRLTPALNEGITASCWVNIRDIEFIYDKSGQITGGTARLNEEILPLKLYDKTARNLAYAIAEMTDNALDMRQDPGQSYEDPGLERPALKNTMENL
jgi:hypothetical protein